MEKDITDIDSVGKAVAHRVQRLRSTREVSTPLAMQRELAAAGGKQDHQTTFNYPSGRRVSNSSALLKELLK